MRINFNLVRLESEISIKLIEERKERKDERIDKEDEVVILK